jgi:hypothetical protein
MIEPCMQSDPDDRKVTCGLPLGHKGLCDWARRHGIPLEFYAPAMTPLQIIKQQALILAGSGRREDFKLVERLFAALPELRDV